MAAWVKGGGGFADIGCDHGLLCASLIQRGIFSRAVASDINPGPLRAAAETFRRFGLSDYIDLRLGGGLTVLSPGEVSVCAVAGMGGMSIISILSASPEVAGSLRQLILSPERDHEALRRYLHAAGFYISRETLTPENGHFYAAIDARPGTEPAYTDAGYRFGARLLESKDAGLLILLKREEAKIKKLISGFQKKSPPAALIKSYETVQAALDNFN
ncbi:MAG: class I SAM-dependent methyltransferase [Defluviitaleaceae bacterium]|nr:class I SAM-dependent methyltransferase [Defluviitaleaceae bacterium]